MLLSEKRFNHYRKRLQENTAPLKKPVLAAYLRPGAPLARRAGGTARGRRYQRRGHRTQAEPVSVLRRSHDNHRDIPARLLAALQSRSVPRRDQDRHITIRSGSMQHPSAALLPRWLFMLALASLSITGVRCATPVLPVAIGRPGSSPPRSLPKQAVQLGNRPPASKFGATGDIRSKEGPNSGGPSCRFRRPQFTLGPCLNVWDLHWIDVIALDTPKLATACLDDHEVHRLTAFRADRAGRVFAHGGSR